MNQTADIQDIKLQHFPETFCFLKMKETINVYCEAENCDAKNNTDPIYQSNTLTFTKHVKTIYMAFSL